jgi:hypothetical protein
MEKVSKTEIPDGRMGSFVVGRCRRGSFRGAQERECAAGPRRDAGRRGRGGLEEVGGKRKIEKVEKVEMKLTKCEVGR